MWTYGLVGGNIAIWKGRDSNYESIYAPLKMNF